MSLLSATLAAVEPTEGLPAAGSPIGQLIVATVFAGTMTAAVLLVAWLHRTERTRLLERIGEFFGRIEGLPGWAVIPAGIGWGSLALAFLGVYWDVSLHIDQGRDPGPLANIAHYPILIGLQGLFLAGVLALVLPPKRSYVGPSAVRIARGWRVPTASLTLMACAVLGYSGFPLDDVWHRLFGQDVTLWGPTHLMMISGAVLSIVALAVLQAEGERAYGPAQSGMQRLRRRWSRLGPASALLIATSLFLGEWDWGVQQYLMAWQPLILAAGAGLALVFARRYVGPGGAIAAAASYAVARLVVNGIVGYGFGQSMPTMPLFFAEALVVEAVFLSSAMRRGTVTPVLLSGLGIGTVGFAAQYAWTQVMMPTPWTPAILGEGLPVAIAGGIAGSALGLLFALALRGELTRVAHRRPIALGAAVALFATAGLVANQDYAPGGKVTTTISDARPVHGRTGPNADQGPVREATLTARFADPAEADDASYVSTVAWQGGGLVSDRMERVAPGVYRTTEPIPLGGSWKTIVRLQSGRRMLAAPVSLPADPGIPVGSHVNPGTETVTLVNEQRYLQRERKQDVPAHLWVPAMIIVLGLMAGFAVALAFAVARVGLRTTREAVPETAAGPTAEPAPTGGTAEGVDAGGGRRTGRRLAYRPSDR